MYHRLLRPLSTAATVNVPKSPFHGSYHWILERTVSVVTLGLISAAFTLSPDSYSWINAGLNVCIPVHSHIGFGAIIMDYIPRRKFPTANKMATAALWASSLGCSYGLWLLNTRDVGIVEGVKRIWTAKDMNQHSEEDE